MKTFQTLKSLIIQLPHNDIDTDQIIPAQYLKVTDKKGLAEGLFASWRYDSSGDMNPDFPLNKPQYQNAEILLTGDNFGCGSSREHAPWALVQWGIRAIISTSFADIFRNNALKNGLLPVVVPVSVHKQLLEIMQDDAFCQVTIDLPAQELSLPDGSIHEFSIDPFNKKCLVEGIDSLGYLLSFQDLVTSFENQHNSKAIMHIDTSKNFIPYENSGVMESSN